MLLSVVFHILLSNIAYALVEQTNVPAILFSYKLSPGIIKYSQEEASVEGLSMERFSFVSKQLLSQCNSDAYVFINLPGITAHDFLDFKKEFVSLQRYIHSASTALGFKSIDIPSIDTIEELIEYVSKKCKIDHFLSIDGNDTGSYEPYIDSARRVVRLDYPLLPEDQDSRNEAIIEFDRSLRTILAQLPSPLHTIILTAVSPSKIPARNVELPAGSIFPEVLLDPAKKREIEKNDHDLKIPRNFNEHRPKFARPESSYISAFDNDFISKNYDLIKLIATSLLGFLLIQLFAFKAKTKDKSASKASQKAEGIETTRPDGQDDLTKKAD